MDLTTVPPLAVTEYRLSFAHARGVPSATKIFPELSSKTGLVTTLPAVKVAGKPPVVTAAENL